MPPRPGPYGHWQQPPRKKSGGAVAVIGALLGTMAALFVLLVIGSAVLKKSHTEEPANPIALPTYTPSDLPSPGETSDPVKPTRRPTPTNDDQPDVDQPPQQVVLNKGLKENTMYKSGALPNTACPAGNVNVFNGAQLKALIIKTGHCMDKGWKQILEKQGIDWSPPGYAIAAKRGRGACGDYPSAGSMVPYYCPRNNTIYASTSALAKGSGNQMGYGQIISWSGGIISMMAHEYGHHVQNLTGILDAHWQKHLASSSESGRLALSRKLELQATCFGGMWMRSVAGSYPVSTSNRQSLFSFYGQVGDWPGYPRDHGSRTNNYRWFRQGYDRNKSYQCNTWLAPASTTS
ncbi:neutral zinc metallopeptidase [Nonomuraea sp. NPDC050556]|uniref:neutral zinc metallopeptidase n=1 Tax=Nonomuraea sp. NPDC050556 TaxID=3364369 RepID=UPI0037A87D24